MEFRQAVAETGPFGRRCLSILPCSRFHSPLIKPDVRISRIRLSGWLHRGHTVGGDMSVIHGTATPWHRDTVSSAKFGSSWCFQAHRQSPHLIRFENAPEVRALSSAGITRLRRSYDPVRLPPWPSPVATLRPCNAGGAKGPDFWCAFEVGEVKVIGDEPDNA